MNQAESTDENLQAPPLSIDVPRQPVVVIGGGVIGAACAYFLSQEGRPVILIEKAKFGQGCSHGNCGFVSPSHVLPLCRPGVVLGTLKTLFQKNSPFKLRPRMDLSLWSWLWQFLMHCNEADMLKAGFARDALLKSSRELYGQMMQSGQLSDCEWEARGLLFVYRTQEHFEHFAATDQLLREEFNVPAQRLDEAELLEREPALKPGIAGAWLYDCDAHLRPDKLMEAWKRLLLSQGVIIREDCEFLEFEVSTHSVSAIRTSSGRLEVDQVLVAAGAWTPLLKDQLGTSIPIQPGKGYSITMDRPAKCPQYPMIFEEDRVAITPMNSAYRIGSTMEFAGYDATLRPDRLNLLIDTAKSYLHEPLTEPILKKWWGWRPMSSDGIPFIGQLPRFRNVWVAAGHSMLGVSMAPATGQLAAELMTGKTPHLDPVPYRVDR